MRKTEALFREFQADWRLSGKASSTAKTYCLVLSGLSQEVEDVTLADVKGWIAETDSEQLQRYRGRAARAFFKWADQEEAIEGCGWWSRIPLCSVPEKAQPTVTALQADDLIERAADTRTKALLAVLWCSGLRVSELCRMQIEHLDLDNGNVLVPKAKSGKPRLAPLDRRAIKLLPQADPRP